jgi:hypothetical protein
VASRRGEGALACKTTASLTKLTNKSIDHIFTRFFYFSEIPTITSASTSLHFAFNPLIKITTPKKEQGPWLPLQKQRFRSIRDYYYYTSILQISLALSSWGEEDRYGRETYINKSLLEYAIKMQESNHRIDGSLFKLSVST